MPSIEYKKSPVFDVDIMILLPSEIVLSIIGLSICDSIMVFVTLQELFETTTEYVPGLETSICSAVLPLFYK